jgi:hypothetical protein
MKKKWPRKQRWIWLWQSGGWNSCMATSFKEALKVAKSSFSQGLIIDEKTLHPASKGEHTKLRAQRDKHYLEMAMAFLKGHFTRSSQFAKPFENSRN